MKPRVLNTSGEIWHVHCNPYLDEQVQAYDFIGKYARLVAAVAVIDGKEWL